MNTPGKNCDECASPFLGETSRMESLCPECAHWLYGTPNCEHQIVAGTCARCGWNGSVSDYVKSLKDPTHKS
jgi:predicted RNA-binding Zn-ribbon protein involved in translation (DUF1610 family)